MTAYEGEGISAFCSLELAEGELQREPDEGQQPWNGMRKITDEIWQGDGDFEFDATERNIGKGSSDAGSSEAARLSPGHD
ncbi:hypothetical protein E4U21_000964 [Claviceps maximensis]|nr:hypothetical protein E4U21_000964 [Claviceps maximensis]